MPFVPKLELNLPFGIGRVELINDQTQQKAAWELYVELATRITIQPLDPDSGLLREALDSLYKFFQLTRDILRAAGPGISMGDDSVGSIAIRVLNVGIRPFTAKWHPLLKAHEKNCPSNVDAYTHEQNWSDNAKMRKALETLQINLEQYAIALAAIAGIKHTKINRAVQPAD